MQSGQKQVVLGKGEKERRERRKEKRQRKKNKLIKKEKRERKERKWRKRVGEAIRNKKKNMGEYLLILYTLSPLTSLGLVRLAGLLGEGPVVLIFRC